MIRIVNKRTDLKRLKDNLPSYVITKNFDAKKFCGALRTGEDALKAQRRLRNEW